MKDLVDSDAQSIWIDFPYTPVVEQLSILRKQSRELAVIFDQFREDTLCYVNQVMGKIASTMHREIAAKRKLQQQLQVVKASNSNMKHQVFQLRQMIQEFVKGYNSQMEIKNTQIMQLRKQLFKDSESCDSQNQVSSFNSFLYPSQTDNDSQRKISLDIIQQVSEYATSVGQTIRQSQIGSSSVNGSSFPMFSNENQHSNRFYSPEKSEEIKRVDEDSSKKAKNFIKAFRKNMDNSIVIESKNDEVVKSHECSMDDLGETAKINLPKNIKSPKNLKSIKNRQGKMKTEGENKENQKFPRQIRLTPNHKRNKSTGRDSNSNLTPSQNERVTRSNGKNSSKQKIKLASKIVQESHFSNNQKYTHKKVVSLRPSVHLGGKTYLKKIARDVRVGLQQFKVWEGGRAKQVKYQGQKKNGMRWGRGKLLYDNGFVYEGSFVQNYKHGIGTMSLNGIVFYEGQWSLDELNGQGYIKSMKNFSENCPKILSQASYCGNLVQNKPNGMGTLFLNQNEKFVTKFVHGVPVGEYTYYNHSQIQFGTWF